MVRSVNDFILQLLFNFLICFAETSFIDGGELLGGVVIANF
jgi:hypothetical protein